VSPRSEARAAGSPKANRGLRGRPARPGGFAAPSVVDVIATVTQWWYSIVIRQTTNVQR
jgi:hypothetical protein